MCIDDNIDKKFVFQNIDKKNQQMKMLKTLSEIDEAKKGNIDNDKIDLLIKKIQSKGKVM